MADRDPPSSSTRPSPSDGFDDSGHLQPGVRLAFLDAVRAFAVLMITLSSFRGSAGIGQFQRTYISLWTAGVLALFLCTGFITPHLIEGARSLPAFWANRFARIWPMYLVTVAAVLVVTDVAGSAFPSASDLTPIGLAANLALVASLSGQPLIVDQSWTISDGLVFYVSLTALSGLGLLKRSIVWATLALGSTLLTAVLPGLRDHHYLWRAGFWAGTLFVGVVVQDAVRGRLPRWAAWVALLAGGLTGEASLFLGGHVEAFDPSLRGTIIAGYAVFAVGLALADHRFPRPLLRIGVVSYSLFLTHKLVIHFVPDTGIGVVSALMWVAVSIGVAEAGFRLVERPAMFFGRRFTTRRPPPLPT